MTIGAMSSADQRQPRAIETSLPRIATLEPISVTRKHQPTNAVVGEYRPIKGMPDIAHKKQRRHARRPNKLAAV